MKWAEKCLSRLTRVMQDDCFKQASRLFINYKYQLSFFVWFGLDWQHLQQLHSTDSRKTSEWHIGKDPKVHSQD